MAATVTTHDRLSALAARIEADPGALAAARADGDALADAVEAAGATGGAAGDAGAGAGVASAPGDGDPALRWRIAVLRAVMAAPPDGDAVRELYGELVDRYRDQPARLAALRPLHDEIRRREADGTLPRSLVARTRRRRPPGA